MEVYAIISQQFSKIQLIATSSVSRNQLDVYLQGEFVGRFITSTHPKIGDTSFQRFAKPLAFNSYSSTEGLRYLFDFVSTDIEQTGTKFEPGVYSFILSNNGSDALPIFGVIQSEKLICCMASAFDDNDIKCGKLEGLDKTNKVNALLLGAQANLRVGRMDQAVCLYDLASYECENCGC